MGLVEVSGFMGFKKHAKVDSGRRDDQSFLHMWMPYTLNPNPQGPSTEQSYTSPKPVL